jgi:hypothetical protein
MRFVWIAMLGLYSLTFGQVEEVKRLSQGYPDSRQMRRLNQILLTGDDAAKVAAAEAWTKSGKDWQEYLRQLGEQPAKDLEPGEEFSWAFNDQFDIILDAGKGLTALAMRKDATGDAVLRFIAMTRGDLDFRVMALHETSPWGAGGGPADVMGDELIRAFSAVGGASRDRLVTILKDSNPAVVDGAITELALLAMNHEERFFSGGLKAIASRIDDPDPKMRAVVMRNLLLHAPKGEYLAEKRAALARTDAYSIGVASQALYSETIKELYADTPFSRLPVAVRFYLASGMSAGLTSRDLKRVAATDPSPDVAAMASICARIGDPAAFNPCWANSKLVGELALECYAYNLAKRDFPAWLAAARQDKRLLRAECFDEFKGKAEEKAAFMLQAFPLFESAGKPFAVPYLDGENNEIFFPAAMRLLESKNPDTRYNALLAMRNAEAAVPILLRYVNDPNPEILSLLLDSPHDAVRQSAMGFVQTVLKGKDRSKVFAAMMVIAEYGMDTHLGDLKDMTNSKDPQFAEYARVLSAR